MISIEQEKIGILVPPQLKDNGAPTSLTYIDTKDFEHLRVEIILGVTDIVLNGIPKLQECDTTGGNYADITGAVLADAPSATEDSLVFAIDVDLTKDRMRYIKCLLTCGNGTTGTNICVVGRLSRKSGGTHNGLATAAGYTELVSA